MGQICPKRTPNELTKFQRFSVSSMGIFFLFCLTFENSRLLSKEGEIWNVEGEKLKPPNSVKSSWSFAFVEVPDLYSQEVAQVCDRP